MVLGKSKDKDKNEHFVRKKNFDPSTCRELGGAFDEDGKCLLWIKDDPSNPDTKILKKVNYNKSDTSSDIRQE